MQLPKTLSATEAKCEMSYLQVVLPLDGTLTLMRVVLLQEVSIAMSRWWVRTHNPFDAVRAHNRRTTLMALGFVPASQGVYNRVFEDTADNRTALQKVVSQGAAAWLSAIGVPDPETVLASLKAQAEMYASALAEGPESSGILPDGRSFKAIRLKRH